MNHDTSSQHSLMKSPIISLLVLMQTKTVTGLLRVVGPVLKANAGNADPAPFKVNPLKVGGSDQ